MTAGHRTILRALGLAGMMILVAGCLGRRLRRLEDQNKQVLRELDEIKGTLAGMDKRLALKATVASMGGKDGAAGATNVATLLADPLAYSGQMVQVEAVLANTVDKDRAFFVVIGRPKDVLNNMGVYYDPEDISTKRDVYLSDPGQWLAIEGQLSVDKEAVGFKSYSGYALKAKSVRRISR